MIDPMAHHTRIADEQPGYAVVAGTTPDGKQEKIIIEPDGTARLSDETVERIAERTARLLIGMLLTGAAHWGDAD